MHILLHIHFRLAYRLNLWKERLNPRSFEQIFTETVCWVPLTIFGHQEPIDDVGLLREVFSHTQPLRHATARNPSGKGFRVPSDRRYVIHTKSSEREVGKKLPVPIITYFLPILTHARRGGRVVKALDC